MLEKSNNPVVQDAERLVSIQDSLVRAVAYLANKSDSNSRAAVKEISDARLGITALIRSQVAKEPVDSSVIPSVEESKVGIVPASMEQSSFPELLKAIEVATILNISERSLFRHVTDKEFPEPIKIGNASRWTADDVRTYLAKKSAEARGVTEPDKNLAL